MHRHVTREQLEQCRRALASADTSDEMRALASDLLDTLLRMYDGGRLSREVLLLVLDSLALIPDLVVCVDRIRARLGNSPPEPGT
ncbi:hypothetical protein LJR039_004807 [Pseudorhodoferax sp. LjRoot39]|uniref:hypothetical protein n=1 Tax=Pseudorhodoferax sp. LjRoot39 TaxID=3342328 RepID=UPI003ECF51EF